MSQKIDLDALKEKVEAGRGINHQQAEHLLKMLAQSKTTNHPTTYLDHILAAQTATEDIDTHANQGIQAAIAQAHALTAIALLLEDMLGAVDEQKIKEPYQTVRIIGGLGHTTAH